MFRKHLRLGSSLMGFRPLAGCGLFLPGSPYQRGGKWFPSPCGVWVVSYNRHTGRTKRVFPSPCGVWVVSRQTATISALSCFRPLAGCGLFPRRRRRSCGAARFPSPCGVWVVSAKLHILSGATGKRIVNSAVLLYHIGRCLSIAN